MLFSSYPFICVFLPLALIGWAAACRLGRRAALGWLAAASLAFYGWSTPQWLPLLLGSILVNFTIGRLIGGAGQRAQTWLLAGGVAANLATLGWYKFGGAALPPGVSFFTFTQIGFLLDCRSEAPPRRSLLEYSLFVGFFPHVIAGPILTARDMMPQLTRPGSERLSADNLAVGGGIFLIGLLKKTLLADPLGPLVAQGFAAPATLAMLPAWQAAVAWALQLYFDFSGYSDMAIGLGRMFGLQYPVNFASPYQAQSIIDYWQRWHMSLTRFLMLRVYAPMVVWVLRARRARGWSVDRVAQRQPAGFVSMLAVPLLTTMVLAGVWHGSGWTFVLFGLLHGVFLAVNHAWRAFHPGWRSDSMLAVMGRVALTNLCVLVGAVVFRAPSVHAAMSMLGGMLGTRGLSPPLPADPHDQIHAVLDGLWLLGLLGIVWLAPNTQTIMAAKATAPTGVARRLRWQPNLSWAVAFASAATLGLLSIGGTSEFVYFQF